MRNPTTVKEIALAAGVSKAAVSKVLHNSSSSVRISEARSNQIREIAEKMGYIPNAAARNLTRQRSQTIGVYFDDLAGISAGPLYTTNLLEGISRVLFKNHYRLAILAELDEVGERHALGDGRLDGVIWCRVVRDQSTNKILETSPIPVVTLTKVPLLTESDQVFSVGCDNAGGVEQAIDHLWNLGHRKVLFVHESREAKASDCVDRRNAFRKAMAARGISTTASDFQSWNWDLDEFLPWWKSQPEHTAILCWSERCAGQILKLCKQHRIRVPADLSVVGFDSTQYCEQTRPRLTAIRQPILEMGDLAATTILNALAGNPPADHSFTLPCSLDLRKSTGIPSQTRILK